VIGGTASQNADGAGPVCDSNDHSCACNTACILDNSCQQSSCNYNR
jgi:hypothetical protein